MTYPVAMTNALERQSAPVVSPVDGKIEIDFFADRAYIDSLLDATGPINVYNGIGGGLGFENGFVNFFALLPAGKVLGEELIVVHNNSERFAGTVIGNARLVLGIAGSSYASTGAAYKFLPVGRASLENSPRDYMISRVRDYDFGGGLGFPVQKGQATMVLRWVSDGWQVIASSLGWTNENYAY